MGFSIICKNFFPVFSTSILFPIKMDNPHFYKLLNCPIKMDNPHFYKLLNKIHCVQAIHTAVKGRVRYKVNGLYHSEALKRYLESRLLEKKIILRASANSYTGNVLVIFNPDKSVNAIALLIQEIVLDFQKQVSKSLGSSVQRSVNPLDLLYKGNQSKLQNYLCQPQTVTCIKKILLSSEVIMETYLIQQYCLKYLCSDN